MDQASLERKEFHSKTFYSLQKRESSTSTLLAIEIPQESLRINVKPINPNSFMDTIVPYWEGPISFTGTIPGLIFRGNSRSIGN